MRRGLLAAVMAAFLGVSGCGSLPVGLGSGPGDIVPEFQHYRDAVRAQRRAGMAVLDRLAIAERILLTAERGADEPGFDPGAAAAFLGVGDPPRTAALRQAVMALQTYNNLLVGLASGTDETMLRAGLGAVVGGTGISPDRVLGQFDLVRSLARRITSIAPGSRGLRNDLIVAGDDAVELIRALRAATPAIWQVIHAAAVEPGNLTDPDGIPPAALAQMTADRRLLAGWVLLLDQSVAAIELAVAVTRSADPRNVAALMAAASQLRGLAHAIALNGIK